MANCSNDSYEEWVKCLRDYVMNKHYTPKEIIVFTVAYSIVTIMGILGNGLVIYVVLRKHEMRTTRNVFITNLAISNFLLAVIWIPVLWVPAYEAEFKYGSFLCKLANSFPGINIYCSTLTISVIAIDRYIVIAKSQVGPERLKMFEAVIIALSIWLLAFGLSLPYLLFFDVHPISIPEEYGRQYGFGETQLYSLCAFQPPSCTYYYDNMDLDMFQDCLNTYDIAINVMQASFLYVIPLFVLVTFNFLLSLFLKRTERQAHALRHRTLEALNSTARFDSRGRRNRTTALLIVMAVSYCVLWFPFTAVTLYLHLGRHEKDRQMSLIDESCKVISMLSICVNPFLYGYLNTNFNREFKSIFAKALPFIVVAQNRRRSSAMPGAHTASNFAYGQSVTQAQTTGYTIVTKDHDSTTCTLTRGWLIHVNGNKSSTTNEHNGSTPV